MMPTFKTLKHILFAGSMACVLSPTICWGQYASARPITLIIPFAPGGATDLVGRTVARMLSDSIRQNVLPENRPGAGGMIGAAIVASAAPDGYTLLLAGPGPITLNPVLQKKMPYDAEKAFSPISLVATVQSILVVHPSVPAKNVSQLIQLAKSRPGQLNFSSAGVGSATHMAGELFKSLSGNIQMTHIAYRGGAPSLPDVMAGRVDLSFPSVPAALAHVQSGRLKALGVTGKSRTALLPTLPTVAESGLRGYEAVMWYGVMGPARLAQDIVQTLNKAISSALIGNEHRERLIQQGADPETATVEEFARRLIEERAKWERVVKANPAQFE